MKKLVLSLFFISMILSGCTASIGGTNNGQVNNGGMVGNDRDEHGCIGSAGYTWCETKQKCLRSWEEKCENTPVKDGKNLRDQKRVNDIRQIQTAIQLYYNDFKVYPDSLNLLSKNNKHVYMSTLPLAPTPVDGNCTGTNNTYKYEVVNTPTPGSSYKLTFCIGGVSTYLNTNDLKAGFHAATPQGIE